MPNPESESELQACSQPCWAKGVATVTVHGGGFNKTWTWEASKNPTAPSAITGTRDGKPLLSLEEKDRAPQGDRTSLP
ncbi:MAG: hypothetical protein IT578_01660 [Verrucomicrobiae bacterium]|nr:hypothetical protein [Verrucomicrobiae bacterium]